MNDFQILGLAAAPFEPLFSLSDNDLAERGMRRMTVEAKPAYPCRVSLEDAEVGDRVILTPYTHHEVPSPYRASGPIFVRERAVTANLAPSTVPEMLLHRELSLRAYDKHGMMRHADVTPGATLDKRLRALLTDERVAYLHIHNAGPGCFNCAVKRA